MNLAKLQSAISPVTQKISDAMSGNVSVCQALSPQEHEIGKTKPNPSGPRELSGRQLAAAGLLVAGGVVPEVARTLNVSQRTIFRWKKDARFMQEIRRRANEVGRITPTPGAKPPPRGPATRPAFDLEAHIDAIRRGLA